MSSLITTPLELLLPYQARWVADESRFKAGIWSRQSGKDFSTAAEAVRDAMLRAKTTWMIAAPSERQAMESLAKCKEWAEAFSLALAAEEIERQDGPNTLLKSGSITFANGSRILAVPGRPDTVRGFSANLVLTEFAFFEDPDATWRAVLPSITNPLRGGEKKVRLITTPNGKTGRGARTYKIISDNLLQPVEGRKQHWSCHVVTIAKAVEDGLPIDIDELRESLDDPIGWAQEYMPDTATGDDILKYVTDLKTDFDLLKQQAEESGGGTQAHSRAPLTRQLHSNRGGRRMDRDVTPSGVVIHRTPEGKAVKIPQSDVDLVTHCRQAVDAEIVRHGRQLTPGEYDRAWSRAAEEFASARRK